MLLYNDHNDPDGWFDPVDSSCEVATTGCCLISCFIPSFVSNEEYITCPSGLSFGNAAIIFFNYTFLNHIICSGPYSILGLLEEIYYLQYIILFNSSSVRLFLWSSVISK